jgi:hypothetical protein
MNTVISTHLNSTVVVPLFLLRQNGLKLWDATESRWVDECSGNETEFKLLKHYPTSLVKFKDCPHCVALMFVNTKLLTVNSYISHKHFTDGII